MGTKCSNHCKMTFDPNKVHCKKVNEIFINCKQIYKDYFMLESNFYPKILINLSSNLE